MGATQHAGAVSRHIFIRILVICALMLMMSPTLSLAYADEQSAHSSFSSADLAMLSEAGIDYEPLSDNEIAVLIAELHQAKVEDTSDEDISDTSDEKETVEVDVSKDETSKPENDVDIKVGDDKTPGREVKDEQVAQDKQETEDKQASQDKEATQDVKQEAPAQDVMEAPVVSEPADNGDTSDVSADDAENSTSGSYDAQYVASIASKQHIDMTTEKFIAAIGEPCRYLASEHGLYASVMIAQAILESGSGNSTLSQAPNNNLFGIKGTYKGSSVHMNTKEDDGTGNMYGIVAGFRAYPSIWESLVDYTDIIVSQPEYYAGVLKSTSHDYRDACAALEGVYATSTDYAESLIVIIDTYNLTRFDKPLDYRIVGRMFDPLSDKSDASGMRDVTYADYIALQMEAVSYLGTPYVWGGSTPDTGFDCSGLVQWVYNKALAKQITRTTYTQQYEGIEVPVDEAHLRMGDLLFFNESGHDTHHVAMYLGDGFFIHAPRTGDVIKVTSLEEHPPTFAKRIATFEEIPDGLSQLRSMTDTYAVNASHISAQLHSILSNKSGEQDMS